MAVHITTHSGLSLGEVEADGVAAETVQDALDLLADACYHGAEALLLRQDQLPAAFFDLQTRLAGEILQKFSNYRMRLVILGDFAAVERESLRAFIRESNRGKLVAFLPDRDAALAWLAA